MAARSISLVSRRFYTIALNLPGLWSNIDSPRQSVEEAKICASRTAIPSISVAIAGASNEEDSERTRVLSMYELVASISSRIRSLSLDLREYDQPYLQQIFGSYSSISLPFLYDFSLEFERSTGRGNRHFCRDWDMPSLRELRIIEILSHLHSDILQQIQTCHLMANEYPHASDILAFLGSLTSVSKLT